MEILQRWKSLTWDDLAIWAGDQSVERGREYQRDGQVEDLAISEEGRLFATVVGGDRYSVFVWLPPQKSGGRVLESKCSCPVGANGCKHAVATVVACLDLLAQNKPVPAVGSPVSRREKFEQGLDADDVSEDEFDEDEDEPHEKVERPSARVRSRHDSRQNWDARIKAHIDAKSREELADLVWSLTGRFPDLHQEFCERIALTEGDAGQLLKQARQELRRVTSEPGWSNEREWEYEYEYGSSIPDYDGLNRRLERLIETGHADAVVELAEEIIERGMEQVSQSEDEGETASALSGCLAVVFRAVAESSLSPARKLLFVIDTELEDEYGVMEDIGDELVYEDYEPAVWSEVADELARRLAAGSDDEDEAFSGAGRRDLLSGWLVDALNKAGREDEVLAVYETEARNTGSYERLVKFLLDKKRYEEVERWAREGIEKTAQKHPGIASNLLESLAELARQRGQWDVVAAHIAWQFFDRPGPEGFGKLMEAAAGAGCEEKAREFALRFLETGVSPMQIPVPNRDQLVLGSAEWPLPPPDYFSAMLKPGNRYHRPEGPHYDVLINMAIAANQSEEVLKWYDLMCAEQKSTQLLFGFDRYSDRVAVAVEGSHPQRSLDIYHRQVQENLTHANQTAYRTVVSYLRRMRPLLKSLDREEEWRHLLADIRLRHRNRPKFMELLAGMDDRTILETQKGRK